MMRGSLIVAGAVLALRGVPAAAESMTAAQLWLRFCRNPDTWDRVTKCYAGESGTLDIERKLPGATIVRVDKNGLQGFYVFVERGRHVQLAGTWLTDYSGETTILSAERVRVAGRSGIRLELGSVMQTRVSVDAQTERPAVMRRRFAAFCLGTRASCVAVVESCDVLVDGKSYFTFRGTLRIRGSTAIISGDRSYAGTCAPSSEMSLLDGQADP